MPCRQQVCSKQSRHRPGQFFVIVLFVSLPLFLLPAVSLVRLPWATSFGLSYGFLAVSTLSVARSLFILATQLPLPRNASSMLSKVAFKRIDPAFRNISCPVPVKNRDQLHAR
jgi:hypothetical protein